MEINTLMVDILRKLINENGRADIGEILRELDISRRTLNYNLKKVNYLLDKFHQGQVTSNNQYIEYPNDMLDTLSEKILKNEEVHRNYIFSQEERKQIIFLNIGLSVSAITLDQMADQMNVSKNTVVNDLLSLKKELTQKGIGLNNHARIGYYLIGSELNIRCMLYGHLLKVLRDENSVALRQVVYQMFADACQVKDIAPTLEEIDQLIHHVNYLKDYEINHNSVKELVFYIILIIMRNMKGCVAQEERDIKDTSEYQAATQLIDDLNKSGYNIEAGERTYLATILLAVRRENYREVMGRTTVDFRQMAQDIIDKFEDYACVKFENKPALVDQLLIHLRPMYYRLVYNVKVDNKYYKEIRAQSEYYYRITKLVGEYVGNKYGIVITDEELAYLCIYFASWMTKYNMSSRRCENSILIICGAGIGTSLFVRQQIIELAGENCAIDIKDVQSVSVTDIMQYGLVVTTLDLELKHEHIIRVNPVLSVRDKSRILNWMNQENSVFDRSKVNYIMNIIEKYAVITDYTKLQVELQKKIQMEEREQTEDVEVHFRDVISNRTVQVCEQIVDGDEAMRIAVMPLVENGIVRMQYLYSIMEAVRNKGLYFEIMPGILLAHARPNDEVTGVGLAVTVFSNGIIFKEKPQHKMHTIIVLATPSNTAHMYVLKELLQILKNPDIKKRLQNGAFESSYELLLQLSTRDDPV